MTARWRYVTPLLWVGETLPWRHIAASGPLEAAAAMKFGSVALLPPDDWEGAAETLRLLGLDEDRIAERIHYAQTGRVLTT